MLVPFASYAHQLARCSTWPARQLLQEMMWARGVRNARGIPIRVVGAGFDSDLSHEERVYRYGELEVRQADWHDLFNVLVWLMYPATKAALNERHFKIDKASGASGVRSGRAGLSQRGPVRDALTLFDENGALFASVDEALVSELRAFRWKNLFWTRREDVRALVRVHVLGHSILHKALSPYVGLTAHSIPLCVDADFIGAPAEEQALRADRALASVMRDVSGPRVLSPLPLLGIPDWWPANECESFYDDENYFRPGRTRGMSAARCA